MAPQNVTPRLCRHRHRHTCIGIDSASRDVPTAAVLTVRSHRLGRKEQVERMKIAGLNSFLSFPRGGLTLSCAAICALGLMCALSLMGKPAAAQGTEQQRQACQPDALRLCSEFVPDVQKITACMVRKRAALSPACKAVFYKDGKPPRKRH